MKAMLQLNFTPFPTLTTQRLVLRQLMADDEQDIFMLRSNEQVNRFLDRPIAHSPADARQFIDKINNGVGNNEIIYWAIALKEDNNLIGTVSLWNISPKNNMAEIGFELLPHFQGKGIMHEALAQVLAYCFDVIQLQSIEAYTHGDNEGSIKLLEKNGFVKQSTFIDTGTGDNINIYFLGRAQKTA